MDPTAEKLQVYDGLCMRITNSQGTGRYIKYIKLDDGRLAKRPILKSEYVAFMKSKDPSFSDSTVPSRIKGTQEAREFMNNLRALKKKPQPRDALQLALAKSGITATEEAVDFIVGQSQRVGGNLLSIVRQHCLLRKQKTVAVEDLQWLESIKPVKSD